MVKKNIASPIPYFIIGAVAFILGVAISWETMEGACTNRQSYAKGVVLRINNMSGVDITTHTRSGEAKESYIRIEFK